MGFDFEDSGGGWVLSEVLLGGNLELFGGRILRSAHLFEYFFVVFDLFLLFQNDKFHFDDLGL